MNKNLYVTEQGARISKSGGHLLVCCDGCVRGDVLISEVESLSLFGAVHPTTDAMFALLEGGTDIAFLTRGGHYKGRLSAGMGKNVALRLAQYDAYRNPSVAMELARFFVLRKLERGLHVLDSYRHNPHSGFLFPERGAYLRNMEAVRSCSGTDRDVLRGLEGNGARIYFACFARCLSCGIDFPGREYRPSRDPVNALLSLGYSLATRSMASLLEAAGFDPMLGFLHEPSYGRCSLACDMVEEFRHSLVDRLVLSLLNRKCLVEDDFETRDEEGAIGQLYLKPDKVKVFLRRYEEFCESPNRVCKELPEIPWRRLMQIRVDDLKRALMEKCDMRELPLDYEFKEMA